ncbi:hypothetical protein HK096_001630, partial [Nowakowskiella sp. JEL0078]
GERAEERWNPTQTVESILISVVSLLNDPNVGSPANVDAGVMFRNNKVEYDRIVASQVDKSKINYPPDFVPTKDLFNVKPPVLEDENIESWWEGDDDDDDMEFEDEEEIEEDED